MREQFSFHEFAVAKEKLPYKKSYRERYSKAKGSKSKGIKRHFPFPTV